MSHDYPNCRFVYYGIVYNSMLYTFVKQDIGSIGTCLDTDEEIVCQ